MIHSKARGEITAQNKLKFPEKNVRGTPVEVIKMQTVEGGQCSTDGSAVADTNTQKS